MYAIVFVQAGVLPYSYGTAGHTGISTVGGAHLASGPVAIPVGHYGTEVDYHVSWSIEE